MRPCPNALLVATPGDKYVEIFVTRTVKTKTKECFPF